MAPASETTFKNIQKTLEPYIRSREEVARIRQILAVHLNSCVKDGDAVAPLSLVDASRIDVTPTTQGLQKEYLEALSANIKAREEFAACCREQSRPKAQASDTEGQDVDRLQEHLAAIRLRHRLEKLQAIERGLNSLEQKPAASPSFLNPEEIFRDSRPLPNIPKELVAGLTLDKAASSPHLKGLIDQLEKHVLRAKLLLKREEQLLEKVKARATAKPECIDEGAKLEALNRTRVELINWIETELGKAAGEDGDAEAQEVQKHHPHTDSFNMKEQLASIKEKYAQYLEVRKTLVELVSQRPQPLIAPPAEETKPLVPAALEPAPTAHLLSPYLEQLLLLSREQKGLIAQKSHINGVISNQLKENSQTLDHLAEESQLIPAHPMPGAARANAAFAEATSATEGSGPSDQVKPWVFAADSAKIATLEAVAEKIEEGQVALEGSIRALGGIQELLGQPSDEEKRGEWFSTNEDDPWLAEGQRPEKIAGASSHTLRKADKPPAQPRTAWDLLDGNLGLLRAEKGTP
ncbi:hypothetical protein C7999DRAFT_29028 [Corynascus novoguineensis]|uniref:Uncharacterized protein n=1 Tax=Corynascus novoguineensis TaxID=1126955 RepID=A0AAN7HTI6_9PEZI|nr:hypothetical protein C7999DRAFT_29028 [Corynascus novoguineensis]